MSSKVQKITVSNLKAISDLTADFSGMTCIITGGNKKGKSSFLKSLPERLRGNKPHIILKKGEKEGFAEYELTTGEKFIWEFNEKKEKLTFISERNIKSSVTKDISTYYFPKIFDVDKFLNSKPADQRKEVESLAGIDFTEINLIYTSAYEDRTWANKKVAEAKAKLIQVDPGAPTETAPTDKLEKELAGIDAHNQTFKLKKEQFEQKTIEGNKNDIEISRLKSLIKSIEERNSALNSEILELDIWLDEKDNNPKNNGADLQKEIAKIKADNKIVEESLKAIEGKKEYDKLVLEADQCDKDVKRIEAEKLDVIKNASMPDGFGFSEDGITYNGFAFTKEQLSSSEIYIAALKLAATGLGEVKTLYFDASLLDRNSLQDIEKWANDKDLQLLIERPSWEGKEISYELISDIGSKE